MTTKRTTKQTTTDPVGDAVVLYARISKDRDDETSTQSQMRLMRQFAEVKGWTVVGEFVDYGKSAFKMEVKRPELEAAMRMLETGHASRLVVWKFDRLTRNARGFQRILERLESYGASFVSVQEPWMDTSSAIGFAIVGLFASMAQMEAENTCARITPWHAERKRTGAVPLGPRPYGYKRTKNALTIKDDEAAIVREIAQRVIAGDSLRSIQRDLNATSKTAWTVRGIRYIVTNPTVAGMRKLSDGSLHQSDQWTAILDPATFTKCVDLLTDPARRVGNGNAVRHLLPGLLTCGSCGGHAFASKRGANGSLRYACRKCFNSIDQESTDAFVADQLLELLDDEAWNELRSRGRKADPDAMDRMRSKLERERQKWIDDLLSDSEWDDTQRQIKDRLAAMEDAEAVQIPSVDSLRDSWSDMDVMDRRLVLTAMLESITIKPYESGTTGTKRIDLLIAEPAVAA